MRHEYIAVREDSLLLIIDLQQAMLKAVERRENIVRKAGQLIHAANILEVPIPLTEQYPQGLGGTDPQVLTEIKRPRVCEKEHFSACMEPDFLPTLQTYQRGTIVVAGTETHVCVLQTCLDLLRAGFQIHLVADGVASRVDQNRDIAIELLRQAGAVITSTEIVIFEWAKKANTETFRQILPIVK